MILTREKVGTVNLESLIDEKIRLNKFEELLIIVPTNRKVRQLKRELISRAPGEAVHKVNIETLSTLSVKLALKGENSGTLIDEAPASVLLEQSIFSTQKRYFVNYKDEVPQGTLKRLKHVISEYKRHGITPETLRDEAKELTGLEQKKALDIADIYHNYNLRFQEFNVKETGDLYTVINSKINDQEENFRTLYPKADLIVLNGFSEFTSPEAAIVNMLADINDARLYIYFDYYAPNKGLFAALEDSFRRLEGYEFKRVKDTSEPDSGNFITGVRENLFNSFSSSRKIKTTNVKSIEAKNLYQEVVFTAKEIRRLIKEEGIQPQNICVVYNLIASYSPYVRDIFREYGIPFNLTDRHPLNMYLPVISIINFLEILENDYYYKNIFRAFSSRYIGMQHSSITDFMKAAAELKVISGYKHWIDRINVGRDNLEDDSRKDSIVELYDNVEKEIESINRLLEPFDENMSIPDFTEALSALIYQLEIPEKILSLSKGNEEENIKALAEFMDNTEELFSIISIKEKENKKYPLSFYLDYLRTLISSSRFNIKERPNYGVLVTTPDEIRGLKFDHLFISGLNDGNFPTRYSPEIFFTGKYRRSEEYHKREERYLFYQTLNCWNGKALYFTNAKEDEKKELVESNFLAEFKQRFDIKTTQPFDNLNVINSYEELLTAAGRNGGLKMYEPELKETALYDKIVIASKADNERLTNRFGGSIYSGWLAADGDEQITELLEPFKKKNYSISQFEVFARCPFKYFAEKLLGLEELSEPTEEAVPLELGSILHDILYRFYTEFSKKGKLQGADDKLFNQAVDMIFNIAEERMQSFVFSSPLSFFEVEKITGIEGNRGQSVLYKFLEKERNNPSDFTPSFFEFTFGKLKDEEGEFSNIEGVKIGGTTLRGKIDRIDLHEELNLFRVIDYKMGKKSISTKDLEQGLELQLPVYMIAAESYLADKGCKPAYPELYSLKYNEDSFESKAFGFGRSPSNTGLDTKKAIKISENNYELMRMTAEKISNYAEAVTDGRFNLTTLEQREKKVCRYCSLITICRITELD